MIIARFLGVGVTSVKQSGSSKPGLEVLARVRRRAERGDSPEDILQARTVLGLTERHNGFYTQGPFNRMDQEVRPSVRETTRWLRLCFLAAGRGRNVEQAKSVLAWLDTPNESLDQLSPFEATLEDHSFARAVALISLTGGDPIQEGTIENDRYREFERTEAELTELFNSSQEHLEIALIIGRYEPDWLGIREIATCREALAEAQFTCLHLLRAGWLNYIRDFLKAEFGHFDEESSLP